MSFGYVGNGTQTLSVRGRTFLGLAVGQAILAIVTAGSVLASSHVGTLQPGGGTITFAGGDVTVKAPDGATSAAVDIGYFPESSDSIAIPLGGANDSGQSGWATLTANGAQTDVAVTLSAGVLESELMHIHQGSCANPGGVGYPPPLCGRIRGLDHDRSRLALQYSKRQPVHQRSPGRQPGHFHCLRRHPG